MTLTCALLCLAAGSSAMGQAGGVHYQHHAMMPPGAIGSWQLLRGGPLPGWFQPVEIKAPDGALISLAEAGTFTEPRRSPLRVGLLVGQVYRLKVMNIPLHEGHEVFPTIELIDRTYAPPGQELRFPIPIDLSSEDLQLALDGKFVTRVVYLEDPRRALPVPQHKAGPSWFEVAAGADPLAAADVLGRPVAIIRLGGRIPDRAAPDAQFLLGCPPVRYYEVPQLAPVQHSPKENAQSTDSRGSLPARPKAAPAQAPGSEPLGRQSLDRSAVAQPDRKPSDLHNPSSTHAGSAGPPGTTQSKPEVRVLAPPPGRRPPAANPISHHTP